MPEYKGGWTPHLQTEARAQGWGIFSCSQSDRPWQLQAVTELTILPSDQEAWMLVIYLHRSGDILAKQAMKYLEKHSRPEYNDIVTHMNERTREEEGRLRLLSISESGQHRGGLVPEKSASPTRRELVAARVRELLKNPENLDKRAEEIVELSAYDGPLRVRVEATRIGIATTTVSTVMVDNEDLLSEMLDVLAGNTEFVEHESNYKFNHYRLEDDWKS